MKKSITFKGQEIDDLYSALSTASNYYNDMRKVAKDKCWYNLTAENYEEYRKWEIRYEETMKMTAKVFALIYKKKTN